MQEQVAQFALVTRGRLVAGESVLVRGAESVLGLAAVQVARAGGAARVVGVGPAEGAPAALAAGADEYQPAEGFSAAVRAEGRVDLVVDFLGGEGFVDALRCLAVEGRAVVLPGITAAAAEFRVNRLLLNNIEVITAVWPPEPAGRGGVESRRMPAVRRWPSAE